MAKPKTKIAIVGGRKISQEKLTREQNARVTEPSPEKITLGKIKPIIEKEK